MSSRHKLEDDHSTDERHHLQSAEDTSTPYDNPASLFRVFPPILYTPSARGSSFSEVRVQQLKRTVAQHIACHAVVYPTPASSSDLFPQHADMFDRLDHPQSDEDWALRNLADAQVRELLKQSRPDHAEA